MRLPRTPTGKTRPRLARHVQAQDAEADLLLGNVAFRVAVHDVGVERRWRRVRDTACRDSGREHALPVCRLQDGAARDFIRVDCVPGRRCDLRKRATLSSVIARPEAAVRRGLRGLVPPIAALYVLMPHENAVAPDAESVTSESDDRVRELPIRNWSSASIVSSGRPSCSEEAAVQGG